MAWTRMRWFFAGTTAALLGSVLIGCGGTPAPSPPENPVIKITSPAQGNAVLATTGSFKDVVIADPPAGQFLPNETAAGKSVGKLYEAVAGTNGSTGLWDKVVFTPANAPAGSRLQHFAVIRTKLGNVKIELWPEHAPNHVRNFIALARAGYYDGLVFDRTLREEAGDKKGKFFEYVEAGSPQGDGDPSYNSIGYWLKPEFSKHAFHDEGTVGACHGVDVETAGCKFYITLTKADWFDGDYTIFGKVVEGLDVLRNIVSRPVRPEDVPPDRPIDPVVMQSVTIESVEVDANKK